MVMKYLKGLKEEHFLTIKKVSIIEKADVHAHTTLILNGNSI